MTPDEELLVELRKINKKLDMITSPFKGALFNFSSGIWHALGSLFGTVVITAIIVYILSQLNITQYFQQMLKQYIPTPQINLELPKTDSLLY